jgi:hypothetical protein
MASDKEILRKLYKIAQNQQKIIRKLAQEAPTGLGSDNIVFELKEKVETALRQAFNTQSMIFVNVTSEYTTVNFDVKIQGINADTGNCTTVKAEVADVIGTYPSLQIGTVTFNGVAC